MLWIAFRLYLWHWNHNRARIHERDRKVVNCFQIVSLTLEPQLLNSNHSITSGCELLSDCIFDIGTTTSIFWAMRLAELWIAFRLYLWHWNHNQRFSFLRRSLVVNCFQIVSLTLEPQLYHAERHYSIRCELLSDCIFDIGTTTGRFRCFLSGLLWIAFRLYLWHWNHNSVESEHKKEQVVNCFQIVSLTLEPQLF